MKNLIIIIGTIILGCFIFNMMITDNDSLYKVTQNYMANAITNIDRASDR